MTLVIGDSHARVIALGQELLPPDHPSRGYTVRMLGIGRSFLRKFHVREGESVRFLRRPGSILQSATGSNQIDRKSGAVFLSLGLHGVYFYNSALWRDYTVDLKVTNRQHVSASALELMIQRFNLHIIRFIADLKAAGIAPVVLSAPALPQAFLDHPKVPDMSPDELGKLDAAFRSVTLRMLRKRGVQVLLPPEASLENGVLRPEFRRSDDVSDYHGNPAYGALVLEQIEAFQAG